MISRLSQPNVSFGKINPKALKMPGFGQLNHKTLIKSDPKTKAITIEGIHTINGKASNSSGLGAYAADAYYDEKKGQARVVLYPIHIETRFSYLAIFFPKNKKRRLLYRQDSQGQSVLVPEGSRRSSILEEAALINQARIQAYRFDPFTVLNFLFQR
jgi:hypothetical protein